MTRDEWLAEAAHLYDNFRFEMNIAGVPVNTGLANMAAPSGGFIFEYGGRQYLQDGAAVSKVFTDKERKGQAKTDEEIAQEKREGVEERLANLASGEFTRRSAAERLSPEEAERNRICEDAIRAAAKASGVKLPTKKADADWWADRVAKYYDKYKAAVDKEVTRRMKAAPADMTGILD